MTNANVLDAALVRDEEEGKMFQGKKLESFRDNKTGSIRVKGGEAGGFTVIVTESGEVTIYYEQRTVRVAPGLEASESNLAHIDDASPRSNPFARKRGAR